MTHEDALALIAAASKLRWIVFIGWACISATIALVGFAIAAQVAKIVIALGAKDE